MSRKKLSPRPEDEKSCVSISSPLSLRAFPDLLRDFPLEVFLLRLVFPAGGDNAYRVRGLSKRECCVSGNHGSIRGSWPIAISDYPRGHSVRMVTRCRSTRGPADRLILTLESSVSRTRPATTSEIAKDGKNRSPEMLKLLADLIVWRRSPPLSSTSLKQWLRSFWPR